MMREITLPLLGYLAIAAVVAVAFLFAGAKLAMQHRGPAGPTGGDDPDPQEPALGGQRPHEPQQARHRISALNRGAWPLLVGAARGRHRPGVGRIPCQRLVGVAHGVAA